MASVESAQPTPPKTEIVRIQPIRSAIKPKSRFQMMLLRNIALRRCSHPTREKPMVCMKNVGRITRKPNSGAVLMTRVRQAIAVFGLRQRRLMLCHSAVSASSSVETNRLAPLGSRTPIRRVRPPADRQNVPTHSVPTWPTRGTHQPATREPRVAKPPVNANQNQPIAEASLFGGATTVIHTRNPKEKSG